MMASLLIAMTFTAAFYAAIFLLRVRPHPLVNRTTVAVVLVVFIITAILSIAQFADPIVLTTLQRDSHALTHGQVWRLFTPLFVQDGGWPGTIFNLATLLFIGIPGAAIFGWRRWLILYFGTGLAAEVVAYTWLRQGFAGNSIANIGLAAGIALSAIMTHGLRTTAAGSIAIAAGLGLLLLGDLHGAAFLLGLALSVLLAVAAPRVARKVHTG